MNKTLSPTMQAALDHAMKNGDGKLMRYPGGFWAVSGWVYMEGVWFGATTVEALVNRGRAMYSEWMERGDGTQFPVGATMQGSKEKR